MIHPWNMLCPVLVVLLCLVACSQEQDFKPLTTAHGKPLLSDGRYLSSYDAFVADPDYRLTRDIWYHDERLASLTPAKTKITVHLDDQRGILWNGDLPAMNFPVCTGSKRYETPQGSFKIIQKDPNYRSRTYGGMYDVAGRCINPNATSADPVPSGGEFVGAAMPLWMRIHGGVGLHVGIVKRDADSHGCIRVPREACKVLFEKCPLGTPVIVRNSRD